MITTISRKRLRLAGLAGWPAAGMRAVATRLAMLAAWLPGWMAARLPGGMTAMLTTWPATLPAWVLLALAAGLPSGAVAQPFGNYLVFSGSGSATAGNGYLEVPDSAALDPPIAMTLEGWVQLATPFPAGGCRSLIGKDSSQSYWLGVCGSTLRASFRGGGSQHDGGTVPAGRWTHVAVTDDGGTQKHYIDGELVGSFVAGGPPGASSAPLEVGGDVSWPESPAGALAEFRLWTYARTVDQIRATINVALSSPQQGLAAVWSLAGTGNDTLGVLNGTLRGTYQAVTPKALLACASPSPGDLCLAPAFLITVSWRTGDGATGPGTVVPVASTGSGIFWFFSLDSWELMVKVIDACALNGSVWMFSAATTNVFYRLEVADVRSGITKIYFNYPGPPAPAVTDTVAFPGSCGHRPALGRSPSLARPDSPPDFPCSGRRR